MLSKMIETSSRNSEVIHAGIYYPPSSLKAKLCIRGKQLLYDYCKSRDIPHETIGKLIVATDPEQVVAQQGSLPNLYQNAIRSGVEDLQFISDPHVVTEYLEPEVICHGALFSPKTGIVDSHSLMLSLLADAEDCANENGTGVTLALNSDVKNVSVVGHSNGSTRNENLKVDVEGMELHCQSVVNCAGLKAGDIAQMVKLSTTATAASSTGSKEKNRKEWNVNRQYFAKGNYYRLQGGKVKRPFQHLVYPIPEKGGLGVHATIDLAGNTRFGPDVEWIEPNIIQNADDIDLSVDPNRSRCFYDEVRKYWPGLEDDTLVPDYCGVRPKLGHPDVNDGLLYADFKIESKADHGITGFVNLQGIESPGLTSSLAIAQVVKQILVDS